MHFHELDNALGGVGEALLALHDALKFFLLVLFNGAIQERLVFLSVFTAIVVMSRLNPRQAHIHAAWCLDLLLGDRPGLGQHFWLRIEVIAAMLA